MKTAIAAGLVLMVAACLATTAQASLVIATTTTPIGAYHGVYTDLADFSYVIPNGDAITSATLQLNTFQAGFVDSSGQSYVLLSINGDDLGVFSASGANLQVTIAGAALSSLASGTAALTWGPFDYYEGSPSVGYSGAILTMNVCAPVPEPTTIVAGALLLVPFGMGAVRRLRGIKN